jgi:putative phosphoesterase
MLIGLLSDTHMPLRARVLPDEVFAAFEGVDLILHAGDLNTLDMLDPLAALAPVRAVHGNTDPWDVTHALPATLTLELAGLVVGLTHGHPGGPGATPDRAARTFPDADVVVFGHSHQPLIAQRGSQLLVNPGSPTDRRWAPQRSVARLWIGEGQARAELVLW